MNDDRHIREEIAEGGAWLRAVAVSSPRPDVEGIMLRVAVAIDEQWLAERIQDGSPVGVAERTGRVVARAVSSEHGRRRWHSGGGRIVRWGFGLSAAAMLSWVVLLPKPASSGGDHEKYLDAFDSYVYAETNVEFELAMIEDALFDLEMDSVGGSVDGWEDSVLTGLSEDIDQLWADGES